MKNNNYEVNQNLNNPTKINRIRKKLENQNTKKTIGRLGARQAQRTSSSNIPLNTKKAYPYCPKIQG